MSVAAKTAYFWRSAAQGLRHAPFIHLIAVITIAIALFAAGLARGGMAVIDQALGQLGGEIQVTAYLAEGSRPAAATALARKLSEKAGSQAEVILPEVALKRLTRELGDLGEVLAELPKNPLPLSIELTLPPEARTRQGLRELAAQLRQEPSITGVDYGEEALDRLGAIARALRYGGGIAFAVAALATIIIVSATLQLAIYARREEIEIQKLVGATDRFVKIPFLIEGLLQGLLGAAVALAGLWAFSAFLGGGLGEVFSFLLGERGAPRLLTAALVLELSATGALLGLFGSFVAVGRFLRV
jgi:cell division transport system permease protein